MNGEPLRAAWAIPLATVNEVRAHMESAFKAIVAQMLDAHAESVAIAERANKRAADIESAAQAAAQRARLESDIELGHSNDLVERLQAELERLREQLHIEANRVVPDDAEAGAERSQREAAHRSEVIALREELQASRAECTDLAHQIELEKAKHARLIAGVRSIQQTKPPAALIGFVVSGDSAAAERIAVPEAPREPVPSPVIDTAVASAKTIDTVAHRAAVPQAAVMPQAVVVPQVVTVPQVVAVPQVIPMPQAAATPQTDAEDSARDVEAIEYARRLLDEIEAVYDADTNSGLSSDELIGRLSGNLRYGAAVFARRLGTASAEGGRLFDQQLTARHDEKGETRFGRHLRVATYEYRKQHDNGHSPAA
jgi:hypothetical protein